MSQQILILAERHPYGDWAARHLQRAAYEVTLQKPADYSGLRPQLPDLVILEGTAKHKDGRVPQSDLDLTKRIVGDIKRSRKEIPMLVTSIYSAQEMINFFKELRELGDDFYVQRKTYSPEELISRVRRMLKTQQPQKQTDTVMETIRDLLR